MAGHPNKHIREALSKAAEQGWTIRKSGPRAHAWGVIFCSFGHRETGNAGWQFTQRQGTRKSTREAFGELSIGVPVSKIGEPDHG